MTVACFHRGGADAVGRVDSADGAASCTVRPSGLVEPALDAGAILRAAVLDEVGSRPQPPHPLARALPGVEVRAGVEAVEHVPVLVARAHPAGPEEAVEALGHRRAGVHPRLHEQLVRRAHPSRDRDGQRAVRRRREVVGGGDHPSAIGLRSRSAWDATMPAAHRGRPAYVVVMRGFALREVREG